MSADENFKYSLIRNISIFPQEIPEIESTKWYKYDDFVKTFEIYSFNWKIFFEKIGITHAEKYQFLIPDASYMTSFLYSMNFKREEMINIGIWRSIEEKLLLIHQHRNGKNFCMEDFCLDFLDLKFPWLLHGLYYDNYFTNDLGIGFRKYRKNRSGHLWELPENKIKMTSFGS